MAYESEGIRHIEIEKKNKVDSDEEDSDDSFYNIKSSRTKQRQLLEGDTENVKLDSLLKAVMDISDRLHDQEEKLKKHELDTYRRNLYDEDDDVDVDDTDDDNDDVEVELKEKRMHKKRYSHKVSAKPRTAVSKYAKDDFSESVSSSDSDQESRVSSKVSFASRTSIKSRPKSGRPMSGKFGHEIDDSKRLSMSFSNDKVRDIDMENQRLLKQILQTKTKAKVPREVKPKPVRVKSAAAINRSKKQQAIDQENMRLLTRLQAIKPTKSLRRDKLLYDHMETEQNSQRLSKTNRRRPVSAPVSRPLSGKSAARASINWNFDDKSDISSRMSSVSIESKPLRASSARVRPSRRVVVKKSWEPGW